MNYRTRRARASIDEGASCRGGFDSEGVSDVGCAKGHYIIGFGFIDTTVRFLVLGNLVAPLMLKLSISSVFEAPFAPFTKVPVGNDREVALYLKSFFASLIALPPFLQFAHPCYQTLKHSSLFARKKTWGNDDDENDAPGRSVGVERGELFKVLPAHLRIVSRSFS